MSSQNTRLFNRSKIAKELGIRDTNTLSKYCGYFIETYLYHELRCFFKSRRKELRSLSKFYAVDPILAKKSGIHYSSTNYWILENFVFLELVRRFDYIWYWHSEKKYEVDFIVKDKEGELYAFQVAQSVADSETKQRELRAIEAAYDELKIKGAHIITESEYDTFQIGGKKVEALPFYRWALMN
jgi:uncharacterized protein